MTEIKNRENVSEIIMKPTAHVKCKIGQDWYKCEFNVVFIPGDCYPDYMEINDYIMKNIDGHELNIEEAAKVLRDKLMEFNPKNLKVTNCIRGCKTHFDVDVTIG